MHLVRNAFERLGGLGCTRSSAEVSMQLATAEEVLAGVSESLGNPRIRVMDPEAGLDEVGLRWRPGPRGLLVWVVERDLIEAVVALAESAPGVAEVVVTPVVEGTLVVARLEPTGRKRSAPVPRTLPPPWPVPPKRRPGRRRTRSTKRRRKVAPRRPMQQLVVPDAVPVVAEQPVESVKPDWVAGALAGELSVPAGIDPDDVTVEVDGARVCRPEGLVVFGRRPHLFLPGMAVLASGPSDRRFAGSLKHVVGEVGQWVPSGVDRRIVQASVLFALTRRSWAAEDRALPVVLELGERLVVHFPPGGDELGGRLALVAGLSRDPLLDIEIWGGRPRSGEGVLRVTLPEPRKQAYVSADERERAVLLALGEGPRSTVELLGVLGWTRSTLRRVLAALVERGDGECPIPCVNLRFR